jgi:hypothetical protein
VKLWSWFFGEDVGDVTMSAEARAFLDLLKAFVTTTWPGFSTRREPSTGCGGWWINTKPGLYLVGTAWKQLAGRR